MKVALFGGTFDPIHLGHLLMAESAHQALHLDRVIFVPAGEPPHKRKPLTSAMHRLAMVRLAVRGHPAFSVSDWEIRQARPVFTYETLAHFQKRYPQAPLHFLIGSDSLQQLPTWREAATLVKQYRFVVIERPDFSWRQVPASLQRRVRLAESIPVPFASHEIRERVRRGASIRYQVPTLVESYITQHRLYRGKS